MVRQSVKSMVELFKELRHIKPQALHFYRLYRSFLLKLPPPALPRLCYYCYYYCYYYYYYYNHLQNNQLFKISRPVRRPPWKSRIFSLSSFKTPRKGRLRGGKQSGALFWSKSSVVSPGFFLVVQWLYWFVQ